MKATGGLEGALPAGGAEEDRVRTERSVESRRGDDPGSLRNPTGQGEPAELILVSRGQLREIGIGRAVGLGRGVRLGRGSGVGEPQAQVLKNLADGRRVVRSMLKTLWRNSLSSAFLGNREATRNRPLP